MPRPKSYKLDDVIAISLSPTSLNEAISANGLICIRLKIERKLPSGKSPAEPITISGRPEGTILCRLT